MVRTERRLCRPASRCWRAATIVTRSCRRGPRWETAGDSPEQGDGARHPAGTRTLPSRGRRARLRRSDSRDSLDDGRPSHDSPPPPSRDSTTKSKLRAEKRRKSSVIGEERTSVVPLLPFSDGDGLGGAGVDPEPTEPPRRSSKSDRRSSATVVATTDSPDRRASVDKPRTEPDRPRTEPDRRDDETGKRRLGRAPSLGARDRPSLWSATEREDSEKPTGLRDGADDDDAGYRPSQRAALGISSDWGGSLNRRRMPRGDAAPATISKASGFKLPAVISGRLARQSESFVSSSPDLFAPPEGRSPRVGRKDLDEILERAARRRSSRQAAGGAPLLTARALFASEPRGARSGRAESADRWERGSEGRPELPDSPGGRSWLRVRRDSDTSDASSAAGRSSSSGVLEGDPRPERPPASPLVAGSAATPRRTGFFRSRAGSEGGILDEPELDAASVGGGWRSATRSWLALGSRSAEAAADDAAETSSVSSSGTDRKSATRNWLAQGRLDADDASETASIGSGSGGSGGGRRKYLSRGSVSAESAEEVVSVASRPPAAPPLRERQEPSLTSGLQKEASDALVNGHVAEKERDSQDSSRARSSVMAAAAEDDGKVVEGSSGDSATLLRRKLAALQPRSASEREADKDDVGSDDLVSRLRQKAAALTAGTDSKSSDSDVLDESDESRASVLRKKIAAMKEPKPAAERDGVTTQDDAIEENRATALRQKLAGLRPSSLTLQADGEADPRGGEVSRVRSPLTPRSPRPAERLSPSEDGPAVGVISTPTEETSRSRPTGRSKLAVPIKPAADSGLPPTDRSPATPRGPRPRSAVRRTSSLTGRDGSLTRSRSRSPVKGRITTLRLKPRRVSQSPDPLGRWRSVEDVLSSPAGPVDVGGDDVSWEPQSGAVEPPPSPPEREDPLKSAPPPQETSPPLPPARPPRRRRSRPGESGIPTKERVDENRNQICAESSESREEESSSPSASPTPGAPMTGDAWLATLTLAGRQRTPSGSSCGSLGSFDLEWELLR